MCVSMASLPTHCRRLLGLLAIACLLVDAGCAGLRCPRCPRIDPSGERCFIWPKDEAAVATVPPPATVFPAATASLPALPGNATAPPVLTDPVFPAPELPAATAAAPGVAVSPVSTQVAVATPQDRLTLSPERILAPVGSEVVLKANICTTEGYTLAEQKIEWMLGRDGVGEFVEVSGKGAFHPSIYPWNRGAKTDNYLATSYTANGPHCINRGTPDPSDDVNILRGDAWVTVTSPREGTSYVTAFTPAVDSWPLRKQMATIYWVDVQWTFPPTSITSSGRETLTTVVTRQTDGTPLAGWIVRYEVADGSGVAGTSGVSEVATDAQGRASVQVSPTAAGAASSKIDIQLVRPANFSGSDSPRLVVGNSSTIINWSGGSSYVPTAPAAPITPVTPPATGSPTFPTVPTTPATPPPTTPATPPAPARLELSVQAPPSIEVGAKLQTTATIRNVGGSPATNVVLSDRFDAGLIFPLDPSRNMIENRGIGTIPAGETRTVPIELDVSKAGALCQDVTVTWDGGNPQSQRVCVTASQPAAQRNASFRIEINASRPGQQGQTIPVEIVVTGQQGQTIPVEIVVTNTGEVPLTNVRIEEEYPLAKIQPQPTDAGTQVISGTITRVIERLDVGARKSFRVNCLLRQATRATIFARGSAEAGPTGSRISTARELEIEITPPGAGGTAQGPGPAAPQGDQPLAIGIQIGTAPAREGELPSLRAGTRANCTIFVRNTTAAAQSNLAIRVFFPQEITPDLNMLWGPTGTSARMENGAVLFTPVANVAAGELLQYNIPVNATAAGVVRIDVQAVSSAAPAPGGVVTKSQNVTVLANRQ
jgi:uncharacterized repeat protein (TIGR01451 family)